MVIRGTCAEGDSLAGDSGIVTGGGSGAVEGDGVEPTGGEGTGAGVPGAQPDNAKSVNIDTTK